MKLIPIPYIPIVVLSILWNVSVFSLPKKIYFMELKSNEPKSAEEFRRGLKEIYAKDSNFELVDEDTIEDLNEKLKKQQTMSELLNQISYKDLDVYGRSANEGGALVHSDDYAISNSITYLLLLETNPGFFTNI
jgi:hypothetical protein